MKTMPGFADLFVVCPPSQMERLSKEGQAMDFDAIGCLSSSPVSRISGVAICSIPEVVREDGSMTEIRKLAEESGSPLLYGGRRLGGDGRLLRIVLAYCFDMKCRVAVIPDESAMTVGAQVAEGRASTLSGMKGFPAVAEVLGVFRALELSAESGVPIHLHGVSTEKGIDLIRKSKKDGLDVTCSVTASSLIYTEEDLINSKWDSFFKTEIPLRSQRHQTALWEAVADGTVDAVTSGYIAPQSQDDMVPFEDAPFTGIPFDGWTDRLCEAWEEKWSHVPRKRLLDCLSSGPLKLLGMGE